MLRAFLDQKSPEAEVRRLMATDEGYDPAVWSQMAEQLGLQGLIVPEEFGGSGYTYLELTVVLEEMGRRLLCAPFFSTVVLAANTLIHSGDDAAKKEHLPGIASGETVATLALAEDSGRWDEGGIAATATRHGDSWTIDGVKSYVLDGHVADLLVVAARTDAGVSLFTVSGTAVCSWTRVYASRVAPTVLRICTRNRSSCSLTQSVAVASIIVRTFSTRSSAAHRTRTASRSAPGSAASRWANHAFPTPSRTESMIRWASRVTSRACVATSATTLSKRFGAPAIGPSRVPPIGM